MARTTTTTEKPSLMSRLRGREPAKVTVKERTNPITGTRTVTKKTETHPNGLGHHGHGGKGPLATTATPTTTTGRRTTTGSTRTGATTTRQQRTPGVGDKVEGAMTKLRGTLTGKPGVKVRL